MAPDWCIRPQPLAPTIYRPAVATGCRWSIRFAPTVPSRNPCRWWAGSSSRPPTSRYAKILTGAESYSAWRCTGTPTRTAGAVTPTSSTTPSPRGISARRRLRNNCWPRTRAPRGIPRRLSMAVLVIGWRTTSTGLSAGRATGVLRCRCGATTTIAPTSSVWSRWPSYPSTSGVTSPGWIRIARSLTR